MNTLIFVLMILGVLLLFSLQWRGRIVCFFKGHKRGKLVTAIMWERLTPDSPMYEGLPPEANTIQSKTVADTSGGFRKYACPRCGRTTKYKVKPALASAPTDGSPHFQELA